uniref:TransThyretin-Related family domain n=1 Tax=Caenorhabditis tropicalis TaxID=1561998 RepID=A0A1I7TCR2_9PELO
MRVLLLALLTVSFVASTTRFDSTTAFVKVVLRCKNPKDPNVKVFLMDSDFIENVWDEDDTLDFGNYRLGLTPEMILSLRGQEFEFSGLDPYLYIVHACTDKLNTRKIYNLPLMESMYRSRIFDVVIDLDTETPSVSSRLAYP